MKQRTKINKQREPPPWTYRRTHGKWILQQYNLRQSIDGNTQRPNALSEDFWLPYFINTIVRTPRPKTMGNRALKAQLGERQRLETEHLLMQQSVAQTQQQRAALWHFQQQAATAQALQQIELQQRILQAHNLPTLPTHALNSSHHHLVREADSPEGLLQKRDGRRKRSREQRRSEAPVDLITRRDGQSRNDGLHRQQESTYQEQQRREARNSRDRLKRQRETAEQTSKRCDERKRKKPPVKRPNEE